MMNHHIAAEETRSLSHATLDFLPSSVHRPSARGLARLNIYVPTGTSRPPRTAARLTGAPSFHLRGELLLLLLSHFLPVCDQFNRSGCSRRDGRTEFLRLFPERALYLVVVSPSRIWIRVARVSRRERNDRIRPTGGLALDGLNDRWQARPAESTPSRSQTVPRLPARQKLG